MVDAEIKPAPIRNRLNQVFQSRLHLKCVGLRVP